MRKYMPIELTWDTIWGLGPEGREWADGNGLHIQLLSRAVLTRLGVSQQSALVCWMNVSECVLGVQEYCLIRDYDV